jgi:hypothetical protein
VSDKSDTITSTLPVNCISTNFIAKAAFTELSMGGDWYNLFKGFVEKTETVDFDVARTMQEQS